MKVFALPENVANAVLQYLAQRPYVEVYQMVAAMQALQPVAAPTTVPVPPLADVGDGSDQAVS
jgi:hypothetical protein